MQIVTQDRKTKLQGLDIDNVYTLTNTEGGTYKVKARLYSGEYILLGEYATEQEMNHYCRIANYEIALDKAETIVYM